MAETRTMGPASGSHALLVRLKNILAEVGEGQKRLDHVSRIIAESMNTEVCSIYLLRDQETLELCATKGLRNEAVHKTRLRKGEGLVGRIATDGRPINTSNAAREPRFKYMPETGEEKYSSFLGVPIQRLGEMRGVLVVQSRDARVFSEHDVEALGVVAMVIAEMEELGAFVGEGAAMAAPHTQPAMYFGKIAQEGIAQGHVLLHEARVLVTNPVADDPDSEIGRLQDALETLHGSLDDLLAADSSAYGSEQREVIETFRMIANSKGWIKRLESSIQSGLSAEASVEKVQSENRVRMNRSPDQYLRERLSDLDDLSNRLLRILSGQGNNLEDDIPDDPVLVARNIGTGELLDYRGSLKGVVLEEGSVGSHATIIARAWGIPLLINVEGITTEALSGDVAFVDAESYGERGSVHLRPTDSVTDTLLNKIAMKAEEQRKYLAIRDQPATTLDGITISMQMNAGLMSDLPNLVNSGAEGVGLFRTELRFLAANRVPTRTELVDQYSEVLKSARGRRVVFRTIDIGSDKLLRNQKRRDEANPAMGWRAVRIGLDRPGVLKMQFQALIRGANGQPLSIMFPLVAEAREFRECRRHLEDALQGERNLGRVVPESVEVGVMLETPSLAFASDEFFEEVDFVSIGGNDLKQFFFAADRENEGIWKRYDTLNISFLNFVEQIVARCDRAGTPVSYCGEDAGRPLPALCLAAVGLRTLSMRSAAIGRIKSLLRQINLSDVRAAIEQARAKGVDSAENEVSRVINAVC